MEVEEGRRASLQRRTGAAAGAERTRIEDLGGLRSFVIDKRTYADSIEEGVRHNVIPRLGMYTH